MATYAMPTGSRVNLFSCLTDNLNSHADS